MAAGRSFGMRTAMACLVAIAVAPVFLLVTQASLFEQQGRLERARANLDGLTQLGAAHQQQLLEGARQMLGAVAKAPPVHSGKPEACSSYFRDLQASYGSYANFGLLNERGELTCRSVRNQKAVVASDRRYFMNAIRTGGFTVGEYIVGRATGRPSLAFSLPVFHADRRELRGVLFVALDLQRTGAELRSLAIPPGMTMIVADNDGTVLAATGANAPLAGETLPQYFLLDSLRSGDARVSTAADEAGREWLYTVRPVGGSSEEGGLFVAGMVGSDDVIAPARRRLQFELSVLAAIVLAGSALAWSFGEYVVARPLQRILGHIKAIGEGHGAQLAPAPGPLRELKLLDAGVVRMKRDLALRASQRDTAIVQLERKTEALRQLNETLEHRVAERTRELEAANLELEAFSYSVSHDLRGPLHVIDGFSKALLEKHGEVLPPQALHYLNRIAAGAQSMNHLIEDLLGFAKGARAMLVRQDIDLAPLAQQVLAQLRQRFPQSPVQVGMDPSMPAVADPALIVVVLDNLIGNAWKFSSRGAHPRIEVASVQAAGAARVYRVCDNGAGFDMAHADKLFMPFQRLHSAAEFEGTGIGLATVRRIVERHGGRIWAQAAPGRGASFYFTLEPQPAA